MGILPFRSEVSERFVGLQMRDQFALDESESQIRLKMAWDRVMKTLEQDVPKTTFNRFLRPLAPADLAEGTVEIHAPGAFCADWVRNKFTSRLEQMLSEELGEAVDLELTIVGRSRPTTDYAPVMPAIVEPIAVTDSTTFRPNPSYTFDRFIVGQSNRMATAGAKAVASDPGVKYNPLFIHGESGLGKTHLLHAIAHEIQRRDPRASLVYITAQQFAEQFVQALQNNRIEQFRRSQRNSGIWLVDDIQMIAGKEKTQEEIFHTFNTLHEIGKQIVICSDRGPRELHLVNARLRSRLEAGLVVDIQAPDTETRAAILLSKAQAMEVQLTAEIALLLAENVSGTVRALEGVLIRLAATASVEGREVTVAMAEDLLERYYRGLDSGRPGFDQIVEAVSQYYKIPGSDIRGTSRKGPIAHARHVAVYVTRELTNDSWKHIGSLFNGKDHTSMMHAYNKISELMTTDRDLSAAIRTIMRQVHPNL